MLFSGRELLSKNCTYMDNTSLVLKYDLHPSVASPIPGQRARQRQITKNCIYFDYFIAAHLQSIRSLAKGSLGL